MLSLQNSGKWMAVLGVAGVLALLLFPGSVVMLAIGAAAGYRGRIRVEKLERSVMR